MILEIAELCRQEKIIGLDTETHALQAYSNDDKAGLDPYKNRIRLIQIATKENSWIIDLNYVTDIEPIKLVISDPSVVKIIQNAKFETINFLHHWNIYPETVFDPMLAAYLFRQAWDKQTKHGLGALCERYLGIHLNKDKQKSDWSRELSESQIDYAYNDVEHLLALREKLVTKIVEAGMVKSAKIEFDAVLPLAQMELYGLTVDWNIVSQLSSIIEERISKIKKYLATELPSKNYSLFEDESINLNSPDQLLDAFEVRTGVRLTKWDSKEKKEVESTDKNALLKHRAAHPKLVDALLDYGSLSQMKSTYLDGLHEKVHPITKKIHPEYLQFGQWQHRCSARNPNLNFARPDRFGQKVSTPAFIENFKAPINFRQIFIPTDGCKYSIADFANNQLRIIADEFFANETSLIEEFNRPNANPYKRIASNGLGKLFDDVTPQERQLYKMLTLSLIFIASARRFCQARLADSREEVSIEQAQAEINKFFKAVPNIKKWHESYPPKVRELGYVTTPFGRRIYIPEEYITPNRASNFPICGTEVDGAKMAIGSLSRELLKQKVNAHPSMFVYDEIVLEANESEAQEVLDLQIQVMRDSMQQCLQAVPAVATGNLGMSWADK